MGNAPEYNLELINERKRNNSAKTNSEGNPLTIQLDSMRTTYDVT